MNDFYQNRKIVITGGFGLIGSALVRLVNSKGVIPYVIEKKDRIGEKWRNMVGSAFHLVEDIPPQPGLPCTIVHLGANVDTTEAMCAELWSNNVDNTLRLLGKRKDYCGPTSRFIYASSGSVYGAEEKNFKERLDVKPLNAYAFTKLQLDVVLQNEPNVYGVRFFNVWSDNESHKKNTRSIIARAMEIKNGEFEIFKTGREDIPDGEQARDFIHVDDLAEVLWHFIDTPDDKGGLFNAGSGKATSFNEIADALNLKKKYIDMPDSVKGQYQYHTCADLTKLRAHGYDKPFRTVKEGIDKIRTKST